MSVGAYNIDTFCKAHGISRPFFYKLQRNGLGPRTIKLGAKTLITAEEAARWRRELEARPTSVEERGKTA